MFIKAYLCCPTLRFLLLTLRQLEVKTTEGSGHIEMQHVGGALLSERRKKTDVWRTREERRSRAYRTRTRPGNTLKSTSLDDLRR